MVLESTYITINNNTPRGKKDIESTINITPITINKDENTEITATIASINGLPINEGQAYFKVNEKKYWETIQPKK